MIIDIEKLKTIFQWNLWIDYEVWILHIITSTIVILFIIAVSHAFENKISACIKYALWLVVAVKLLVPIPNFESQYHILNWVDIAGIEEKFFSGREEENVAFRDKMNSEITEETLDIGENGDIVDFGNGREIINGFGRLLKVLTVIYLIGAAIISSVFLIGNIRFQKHVKRNGKYIKTYKDKLPVYKIEKYYGACLYGGFKPIILVGNNKELSIEQQHMILTHEYVHYLHRDHIWSVVRCLCIILYWYHPCVWLAVYFSRRDSELACDEETLKRIGRKQRFAYGQSLLEVAKKSADMKNKVSSAFFLSTMAIGGKEEMKKRITMIAKGTKTNATALLLVLILLVCCMGCTLGSPLENSDTENEDGLKTEEALQEFEGNSNELQNEESVINSEGAVREEIQAGLSENVKFIWPTTSTVITTSFGTRVHPITGEERKFEYLGIAGNEGDSVYAVADGTIVETGFDSILGNYIILTTKAGEKIIYGHLSGSKVPKEAEVKAGEIIGLMGKTGSATGVFLSLSVEANGEKVDPIKYFN